LRPCRFLQTEKCGAAPWVVPYLRPKASAIKVSCRYPAPSPSLGSTAGMRYRVQKESLHTNSCTLIFVIFVSCSLHRSCFKCHQCERALTKRSHRIDPRKGPVCLECLEVSVKAASDTVSFVSNALSRTCFECCSYWPSHV